MTSSVKPRFVQQNPSVSHLMRSFSLSQKSKLPGTYVLLDAPAALVCVSGDTLSHLSSKASLLSTAALIGPHLHVACVCQMDDVM